MEAVQNLGSVLFDSVMGVSEILEAATAFSRLPWTRIPRLHRAVTGSGIGFGMEFQRLAAERMDRLELALEQDLGRNSGGCLRRGWTGWNSLWSWIWEGILEAACGEAGQAGSGSGSGKEFLRLPAERMGRLELALELDLGRNSRGCLRRG
jgi:hypothetical protein